MSDRPSPAGREAAGPGEPQEEVPTLPERLERTAPVRLLLSVVIVVLLLAQAASHVPTTAPGLRDAVREPGLQVQRVTTAEMQWGVFAPDPRRSSLQLQARVEFADGAVEDWWLPQGGVVVTNLRYYRWRKWLERARGDNYRSLWRPTAEWIATLYDDRDSPVTSVTLIRWSRPNQVRGPQPDHEAEEYFTLEVEDRAP
jgi:hypothetical protein